MGNFSREHFIKIMKKSIFDIDFQNSDTPSKIVVGLERLSEAFRVLLWEHAKVIGLSPIQIQILIFIAFHDESICNVSHLAQEFNLTKPTISDAVRILDKKGLIAKITSPIDKRAYSISLSKEGKAIVKKTQHFAQPIYALTNQIDPLEQEQFFKTLSKIIYGLNQKGILSVQRICHNCRFFGKKGKENYCNLIEKILLDKDIRLDCGEFENVI